MSRSVAAVKIVVACLCAALAACSGGANSDEIVELTTTSQAVESTTAPSTTTSPTTTEAPTTTTTEPQTTSTTTAEDLAAEIEAAVLAARSAFVAYAYDPSQANRRHIVDTHTPEHAMSALAFVDDLHETHTVSPAHPDLEAAYVESVTRLGEKTAVAVVCVVSNSIITSIDTGELNEDLSATRYSTTVVRAEGQWINAGDKSLTKFEGVGTCD